MDVERDPGGLGPSEVETYRRLYAHDLDRRLLGAVAVGPGETVLELACGLGAMCLRLAALVQPGGRTICSDIRPERVAASRRLVDDAGLDDVDVRVLDMLHIDLADASVDGIVCRWGFMFPLPTATAFGEARRVLRPGRRLAMAAWADPRRNPWIGVVDNALAGCGMPPPVDRRAPGQMFSLGDREGLRAFLDHAGFEVISIDDVALAWEYDSFDNFWIEEALVPGPYENFMTTLPPPDLIRVQGRLRELLEPFGTSGGGYRIPGVTLLAVARRPFD